MAIHDIDRPRGAVPGLTGARAGEARWPGVLLVDFGRFRAEQAASAWQVFDVARLRPVLRDLAPEDAVRYAARLNLPEADSRHP